MKILHICTTDRGGAAAAALRLHQALLQQGADSNFVVLKQFKPEIPQSFVFRNDFFLNRINNFWNRLLKQTHWHWERHLLRGQSVDYELFTLPNSCFDLSKSKIFREADIIHLHWVSGFVDYTDFFTNTSKSIVWTLHDTNAFTGGCHYTSTCTQFETACQVCPQLQGTKQPFLAKENFQIKEKALETVRNMAIVAPSKWLVSLSQKSRLLGRFEHFHVPYSLDLEVFKPYSQAEARQKLGLPLDAKILLFVAQDVSNQRKGFHLLSEALQILQKKENILVCTIGKKTNLEIKNLTIKDLGFINSLQTMAEAYSAADVFVIPSLEDNLPNTVLESLACGTPVIGFPIGGIADMVKHHENGLLAEAVSAESLAETIEVFFEKEFDKTEIRKDAEIRYAHTVQAKAYLEIYGGIRRD